MFMAQTFPNLLEETLDEWKWAREQLVMEAENIPADRYDYRPDDDARSVREVIQHIMELAEMMTAVLIDPAGGFHGQDFELLIKTHGADVRRATTRDALLALLRLSYDRSVTRFRDVGEIGMLQLVTRFDGRASTRLAWLHHGIAHEQYHTGQLTAYERALKLEPALTQMILGKRKA
jgi:uncharacterized damage-inducible protein DinB